MVWPTLGSKTAKEQNSRALDRGSRVLWLACLSVPSTGQQEEPDFSYVEESIRMTEDRDRWRQYVHGVASPRREDG